MSDFGTVTDPVSGNVVAGDVISNNQGSGVVIGAGASANRIQGNEIGTDATGTRRQPNTADGVLIAGVASNIIGVDGDGIGDAREGNVIAGNGNSGVELNGTGATGNVVAGNFIGTNSSGDVGLGNGVDGVAIDGGANRNRIGTSSDGTNSALAANVIVRNTRNGVSVGSAASDTAAVDNTIMGNSIFGNTKLGIDVGNDGLTLNDSRGHSGPNLFQDFPDLSAAEINSTGGIQINGTANGPSSSTVIVALYANSAADPSGFGQGQTFLGLVLVPIVAGGTGSFSFGTSCAAQHEQFHLRHHDRRQWQHVGVLARPGDRSGP